MDLWRGLTAWEILDCFFSPPLFLLGVSESCPCLQIKNRRFFLPPSLRNEGDAAEGTPQSTALVKCHTFPFSFSFSSFCALFDVEIGLQNQGFFARNECRKSILRAIDSSLPPPPFPPFFFPCKNRQAQSTLKGPPRSSSRRRQIGFEDRFFFLSPPFFSPSHPLDQPRRVPKEQRSARAGKTPPSSFSFPSFAPGRNGGLSAGRSARKTAEPFAGTGAQRRSTPPLLSLSPPRIDKEYLRCSA